MGASLTDLNEMLEKIDNDTKVSWKLAAIGGTAMTIHKIKNETRDVDFIVNGQSPNEFYSLFKKHNQIHIDTIWPEKITIPNDYESLSIGFGSFKNLTVCAVCIEDIVITKAARLIQRDENDIEMCSEYTNFNSVLERYKKYPFNRKTHLNLGKVFNTVFKISWDEYDEFNAVHY